MESLVLFGAGASFGAGYVVPSPPPLGGRLYDALRRFSPDPWAALPRRAAEQFARDFEDGMAEIISGHTDLIAPLMKSLGLYFTQFRLPPLTADAYTRFVGRLQLEGSVRRVTFSTLNYDCLLEAAIEAKGYPVDYFGDRGSEQGEAVRVIKLHGSCNFRIADLHIFARTVKGFGKFDGPLEALSLEDAAEFCAGPEATHPAMAFFAPGKPVQVGPSGIDLLQQEWSRRVSHAGVIALVGVNPNPADGHIWKPLAATPAGVLFVGSKDAFDGWVAVRRRSGPNRYLAQRFSECVDELARLL